MTTHAQEVRVDTKVRKVIYIRSQGIIVYRRGDYFELSMAGIQQPARKNITRVLKPLRDARSDTGLGGLARCIEEAFKLFNPSDNQLDQLFVGFKITHQ